jgi:hypothetical protein
MPDFRDPFGGKDPRLAPKKDKDKKKDEDKVEPHHETELEHYAKQAGELVAAITTVKALHSEAKYEWENGGRAALNRMRNFNPFPQNRDPMGGAGRRNDDVGREPEQEQEPGDEFHSADEGDEVEPDQEPLDDVGEGAEAGAEAGAETGAEVGLEAGAEVGVEAGVTAGEIIGDIAMGALMMA